MSMGDMQLMFDLTKEIIGMFDLIQTKSEKVQRELPAVEEAGMTAQQATRIMFRFNSVLAHLGLPKEINAAIRQLQQLVFISRMVLMSMSFLSMGTGYGAIMGIFGIASAGLSSIDWVNSTTTMMGYETRGT